MTEYLLSLCILQVNVRSTHKTMHVQYDPSVDAMYIRLTDGEYEESIEAQPGVLLDVDKSGTVVGIELLGVSERIPSLNPNDFRYEVLNKKQVPEK